MKETHAVLRRLRWFARNVGFREGAKIALLLALVVLILARERDAATRWHSVLLLVVPFGLTYCLRGALVRDPAATQRVMNPIARVLIAASVIIPVAFPRGVPGAWAWLPLLLGTYLGCYFWLLSDETVFVQR